MIKYVGVGDVAVSATPGETLKTMALGSCVAVLAVGTVKPVIGLLHIQLPESSLNAVLAQQKPAMFADTGIPLLIKQLSNLGIQSRDLTIKLAGGAQIMDPNNTFNIGKRNILATRKVLWNLRLWPAAEDVGGEFSRTVTMIDRRIILSSPGREDWEL
ncbi:MAG: chemotaxis protein CheD [Candidatus Riflebacteria bacterium]|nr:chemotaxis protein CheD [Candidatus Riflebacteria bacterium]